MAALAGHDTLAHVHRIDAPTLVVHGDADPVIPPAEGRRLAGLIPGARLDEVPGARHAVAFEFRARVAALVSDFVLAHEQIALGTR
jgi:3-oxoadipate enol-lactonase